MSGAMIILGGVVYIALSLYFKLTPRLRVVAGLVVGGLLSGVVTTQITKWFGKGTGAIAGPISEFIGQSEKAVAAAIPGVTAFALTVIVVVFLRRKGGGGGKAAGKGAVKGAGGGGLANIALVCALLLPIIAVSVGDAVRSVSQ